MTRLILLLFFIPFFGFGQEQVSHLNVHGVYVNTPIDLDLGFMKIGDVQYMLEERDSLVISKYSNGSFIKDTVIPNFKFKTRQQAIIPRNRSNFIVQDTLYYRIFDDGFQVVDVANGLVVKEVDLALEGIERTLPIHLSGQAYYFDSFSRESGLQKYFLDLTASTLTPFEYPESNTRIHRGDVVYMVRGKKVLAFYPQSNTEVLIYESSNGIYTLDYSDHDEAAVIVDNDGNILRVDNDLMVETVDCALIDPIEARFIYFNGHKAIVGVEYYNDLYFQDSITVVDLNTCSVDMSFITDPMSVSPNLNQKVLPETSTSAYSLVGYLGYNAFGLNNNGAYFVIDHQRNRHTQIRDIHGVQNYTPFLKDDFLYMIGNRNSHNRTDQHLIVTDLEQNTYHQLFPQSSNDPSFATMGFYEVDGLVCAFNKKDEDVGIYRFELGNNTFERLQSLDFGFNLGVEYVHNVVKQDDRIYFSNNSGIYSLREDDQTEHFFDEPNDLFPTSSNNTLLTQAGDKIVAATFFDDNPCFYIFEPGISGAVDTICSFLLASSGIVAGPYIFLNVSNAQDVLNYFDTRSQEVQSFVGLPSLTGADFVVGDQKILYIHQGFGSNAAYLINQEINEFEKLDIWLTNGVKIAAGYDDSFYLIENLTAITHSKIRLLRPNGSLETIYEGEGVYTGYSVQLSDNKTTIMRFETSDDKVLLVANDLETTDIRKVSQEDGTARFKDILSTGHGKVLFESEDDLAHYYWLYTPFEPLVEIYRAKEPILYFSDFSDSVATLFVHDVSSEKTQLVHFNHFTDTAQLTSVEAPQTMGYVRDWASIGNDQFLFSAYGVGTGNELWKLDVENEELVLFNDFYPGANSSFPDHFTPLDGWVYFVMRSVDNAKQWYRLGSGDPNRVEELVGQTVGIKVYPSPTEHFISLDIDLTELSVYDVNGRLIHQERGYSHGNIIDVSFLKAGHYWIMGVDKELKRAVGKFVKING